MQIRATPLLHIIIEDGIEAAKQSYSDIRNKLKLEGAIAGFEACRNKLGDMLEFVLNEASLDREAARNNNDARYWYYRCKEAEIEWVCNVISAARLNQGLPTIVNPTARGMQKAAEILGIKEK